MVEELRARIREVPDFPHEGILFYDITTVLQNGPAFRQAIDLMTEPFRATRIDVVAAMESRGFIFGAPIATALGVGFVPIRKLGKLCFRDNVCCWSTTSWRRGARWLLRSIWCKNWEAFRLAWSCWSSCPR
jgi:adenine phosphoribosyltransferase